MTTPIATAYVEIRPATAHFGPELSRSINEALAGVKTKAKTATDAIGKAGADGGRKMAAGIHEGTHKAEVDFGLMGKAGERAFDQLKEAGKKLAAAFAAEKLGEIFIKAGENLETLRNKIIVATGASGAKLEGLTKTGKDLAAELPASFGDIGDAVAKLNAGLHLTGGPLDELATKFLDVAKVTGTALDIPTTTQALTGFGVAAKDQGDVLESLFTTAQKTGVGISDLVAGIKSGNTVFPQFGLGAAQTGALLGGLQQHGIASEKVVTGLRVAFQHFSKEGRPAQGALTATVAQMKKFIDAGNTPAAGALASKVFGSRGAVQFVAAVKSGALSVKSLTGDAAKIGAPIEDAEHRTRTFSDALKVAGNNLNNALGGPSLKVLEFAKEQIEKLTGAFRPLQPAMAAVGGFIATTLVPAVKDLATRIAADVRPILASLATTFRKDINPALRSLAAHFTDALPGIKRVAGFFLHLQEVVVKLVPVMVAITGKMISFTAHVVGPVIEAVSKLAGFIAGLADKFLHLAEAVGGTILKGAADVFLTVIGAIIGAIGKLLGAASHIPGIGGKFKGAAQAAEDAQSSILGLKADIDSLGDKTVTVRVNIVTSRFSGPGGAAADSATALGNEFNLEKPGVQAALQQQAANKAAAAAKKAADAARKAAADTVSSGGGGGGGGAPDTSAADAAKAAAKTAAAALRAAGRQVAARTFVDSITGGADKIKAAFDKLLANLKTGQRPALVAYAKGIEHDLLALAGDKAGLSAKFRGVTYSLKDLQTKLKDLRKESADFARSVKDNIVALGSVAEAPKGIGTTFTGIRNNLRNAILQAKEFAAAIATLQRLKLNPTSLRQLIDAGPEAGLAAARALARSGAAGVSGKGGINELQKSLTAQGKDLGTSVAKTFFGHGIQIAAGLLSGLQSQEAKLDAAMKRLADRLAAHLKDALGIHSRSEVFYRAALQIPAGVASGVRAGTPAVHAAAAAMSNSVVFGAGAVQVHGVADAVRAREVGSVIGHGVADLLARNGALAALGGA